MSDIEQSIIEWRKQMLAAGMQSPVPLEELEGHLRDEIARQMQAGATDQQAFETAVHQLGPPVELKREFGEIFGWRCPAHTWRQATVIGGVGLTGTIILNLLGRFVFHRSSSICFTDEWWSAWLPCYIFWTTFLVAGAATCSGFGGWRRSRKPTKN